MRGFSDPGSSYPPDWKRAKRRAREEAIELARGESLNQVIVDESRSVLDAYVRAGAQQMLQRAFECEVEAFLEENTHRTDEQGRKQVVRNGYLPARSIMTGAGPLEVQQPRAQDKTAHANERVVFASAILPPFLRKNRSIEELIPWLSLKGVSTGDDSDALQALVGKHATDFSPNAIMLPKEKWGQEYEGCSRRDLVREDFVSAWADGIHVNGRPEDEGNQEGCLLFFMGAPAEDNKGFFVVIDGVREIKQSWQELLDDPKQPRPTKPPKLVVGDGALGFWAALCEVYLTIKEQQRWVDKTANVIIKMPRDLQAKVKSDLHQIWLAETREMATKAFDHCLEKYGAKYEAACSCPMNDREALLVCYEFAAGHCAHLRKTNPIESTFSTIPLRHRFGRGSGSRKASLTMHDNGA